MLLLDYSNYPNCIRNDCFAGKHCMMHRCYKRTVFIMYAIMVFTKDHQNHLNPRPGQRIKFASYLHKILIYNF